VAAVVLTGASLFAAGCDATTKATIEDGIITSSTSLLAAFFRATINAWTAAAADPNSLL
jgi:hypothetical protein